MQYFLHSFAANSVFFHLQDEDMLNVAAWEDKAIAPEPFDGCKSLIHYDSFIHLQVAIFLEVSQDSLLFPLSNRRAVVNFTLGVRGL